MTEIVNSFDLKNLEQFLLILSRITAFMSTAPIFSMGNVPSRVKVGLCVLISALLYGVVGYQVPEYTSLIEYAMLVIMESTVGLLIGFGAYMCTTIITFTGKILDMEIGLSMAQMFDPSTKTQSSLVGTLYNYMIMIFMIMTDMHLYLLRVLADSYQVVSIGNLRINGGLYNSVLEFLTDYVLIGFKLALPIFAAMLVINIVMGVLAKAAPQMSMFAVGVQIKVLIGLIILYLVSVLLPDMAEMIFDEIQRVVTQVLKGMR